MHSLIFALLICVNFSHDISVIEQSYSVSGRVVAQNGEPVPFASIALLTIEDRKIIAGSISNLDGDFNITWSQKGVFSLEVSFLGYKTFKQTITTEDISNEINLPLCITLEEDGALLDSAIISDTHLNYSLKNETFTFANEDVRKAKEGRDLIATLPNLHINALDNKLSTLDGKTVLILINGIKADDAQLRLLSPNEIRSADYYDIPPLKYMNDAETVINVKTKPIEKGFSVDYQSFAGTFYAFGDLALSYIKKGHKITAEINPFINPYLKRRDIEHSHYEYVLNGNTHDYNYSNQSIDWGQQYSSRLTWEYVGKEQFQAQVSARLSKENLYSEGNSDISVLLNEREEQRNGMTLDTVKTSSPSLDMYISKSFDDDKYLTADLLYVFNNNNQHTLSQELIDDNRPVYKDYMELHSRKNTLVPEIDYSIEKEQFSLSLGYKAQLSWLSNIVNDGISNQRRSSIFAQTHNLYAEYSSEIGPVLYGVSLGGTFDIKKSDYNFSKFSFTPDILIRWNVNNKNSLRFNLSAYTTMPDVQQMSDNRIMILEGIYAAGNTRLESFATYLASLKYRYHKGRDLDVTLSGDISLSPQKSYHTFLEQTDGWIYTYANAFLFWEGGPSFAFTYYPHENLRLAFNGRALFQSFKETKESLVLKNWYFPANFQVRYSNKHFALSYYQMLGGLSLDGNIYLGLEKSSYINATYTFGDFTIGLRCFFPFIKDNYSNTTSTTSKVTNESNYELKTKNHSLGIVFSWNFSKGKELDTIKDIENDVEDTGKFIYDRKKR